MEARWTRVVTAGGLVLAAMGGELMAQAAATQRVNFRVLPTRRAVIALSAQPEPGLASAVMRLATLTLSTNEPGQKLVASLDRLTPDRASLSGAVVATGNGSSEGPITSGTEAMDVLTPIPVTGSQLPIALSMGDGSSMSVRKARLVTYTLIAAP